MKKFYIFVCLSLAIVSMGFIRNPGSMSKELKKSIALGKVKEVKTELSFTAGELNINSSTNQLSEGTYRFNIDKWKPEITYTEENLTGYLKIKSANERDNYNYDDKDNCIWDLSMNKKVKNDLTIKMIAGKGNIDLQDCDLKRFHFSMVAGEVIISLKNTSVPNMEFKAGAGSAVIDLSGKWNNDLNANIKGGVGELTLKLPSHTGIKLDIHGFLGGTNTPGLKKENGYYTNALYGKTKETLYIDFSGGIGNINVKLVD